MYLVHSSFNGNRRAKQSNPQCVLNFISDEDTCTSIYYTIQYEFVEQNGVLPTRVGNVSLWGRCCASINCARMMLLLAAAGECVTFF